jgi:hypothetical protein
MALTSLTGPETKQFQEALLSAYPGRSALARMVKFGFGENLDSITGNGSLSDTVFGLITWAEAKGRLETLLSAARAENPGNVLLLNLELRLVPTVEDPKPASNPAPVAATGSRPDRIAVREAIKQHYSLDEMRTLCDDLGIDYENLPGETRERKALELVGYFERHGPRGDPLAPLVAAIRKQHKGVI